MRNAQKLITPEFLIMLQTSTINTFSLLENLVSWLTAMMQNSKLDFKKLIIEDFAKYMTKTQIYSYQIDFESLATRQLKSSAHT